MYLLMDLLRFATYLHSKFQRPLSYCLLVFACCVELPKQATKGQEPVVLTSIEQIHKASPEELASGLSMDLECIVLCYDPDWAILFVSDGKVGYYAGSAPDLPLQRGDRIRIHGQLGTNRAPMNCRYDPSSNEVEMPIPKQVDFDTLFAGHQDSQLVEIEGQLVGIDNDQRQMTLEMRTESGGRFRGLIHNTKMDADTLHSILGKRLRLRGVVGARFDKNQAWSGFQIWLGVPENIIELVNPGQPLKMPMTPISRLTPEEITATKSSFFRTRGKVTFQISTSMMLLEDDSEQIFIELTNPKSIDIDQSYEVTGCLDTSVVPSVLRMSEAVRTNHAYSISKTADLRTIADLSAGDFSGRYVRTTGTYSGPFEGGNKRGFLLRSGGNLLPVFTSEDLGDVAAGTSIDVQGIWIQQKSLVGFNIGSAALYARKAGIKVGTQVPWLFISLLALTILIAAVSCIWVVTLRKQVRRKTNQFLESVALKHRMEEQYANIFINARVMVITTDPNGRISAVNPATMRVTGRAEGNLVGRHVAELVHEESQEILGELLSEVSVSERIATCQVKLQGDSDLVPQEVSCWSSQAEGATTLHLIWHDITERLRIEKERFEMEQRMLSMQKMESLGVLAGGIAHDFNNLLTVISGNAELLSLSGSLKNDERENIQSIQMAATRAAELTQQMLAYAGRGRFDIRVLDVSRIVADLSPLLNASVPKYLQLFFKLIENLPGVKADATQLKQILMNLVRNAAESMEGRNGTICIETYLVDQPPAAELNCHLINFLEDSGCINGNQFVCLEVTDEGVGIDIADMPRIFDPFYSTKFSGRGLGLSTVMGIVRGHHGALRVCSKRNEGTSFQVFLPVCHEPISEIASPYDHSRKADAIPHVIAVDDEPSILKVLARSLELAGIQVTQCSTGEDALRVLKSEGSSIDCLITDQTMPEMSGLELCKKVHAFNSALPTILCSGYSLNLLEVEPARLGIRAILQKPFQIAELVELIQKLSHEETQKTQKFVGGKS